MYRSIFLSLIIVLSITFCSSASAQRTYTVKPGDSLSVIAEKVYGRGNIHKWRQIYEANKNLIGNPRWIKIGWVLTIPGDETQIIRLVTGNNYAPYADERLPNDGMITDIVGKVFNKLGKTTQLEFWAWKLGFDATKNLRFDAAFPWLKNKEREQDFYFSEPIYFFDVRCFVKSDSSIKYETENDFKGLTFCRPDGWYMHDIKDLRDNRIIKLERPDDINACFKMLKNGEVDLVPTNDLVGWASINKTFDSNQGFRVLDKVLSRDSLHLIISKDHPYGKQLKEQFDQTLGELRKEGKLQKIISDHIKSYRIFNDIP